MEWNKVQLSDAMVGVEQIPDGSIQCCVTSPPYFRQRDYGVAGQWGQENSPEEYIGHLVQLFRNIRRVLTDIGTVWIVLGDSYAAKSGHKMGDKGQNSNIDDSPSSHYHRVKRKDLLGIPWTTALALRKDGWFLRQDIIWSKTNPMPESVKDRCTRSHVYIFMFSKSERYYYDNLSIGTPLSEATKQRLTQRVENQQGSNRAYGKNNAPMKASFSSGAKKEHGHGRRYEGFTMRWETANHASIQFANRRSVWSIATAMSKEDHFASFPQKIPELCIKAGSQEGDIILDPFAGTGTTLLQASILGRKYIGFDLNPKYVAIAKRRLKALDGIFFQG